MINRAAVSLRSSRYAADHSQRRKTFSHLRGTKRTREEIESKWILEIVRVSWASKNLTNHAAEWRRFVSQITAHEGHAP
jgi:hypothetical protein